MNIMKRHPILAPVSKHANLVLRGLQLSLLPPFGFNSQVGVLRHKSNHNYAQIGSGAYHKLPLHCDGE